MKKDHLLIIAATATIFSAFLLVLTLLLQQRLQAITQQLATTTHPQVATDDVQIPPADPTADWQTYTNTEYGFLIKYPSTYTIDEDKDGVFLYDKNTYEGSSILFQTTSSTFSQFKQQIIDKYPKSGDFPAVIDQSEHNIGYKKIVKLTVNSPASMTGNQEEYLFLETEENNLVIKPNFLTDPTVNQILNTFKFLD